MKIIDQPSALRGANLVLGYAVASAALWVLSSVAFRLVSSQRSEAIDGGVQLLWLGLSVLLAVGVVFIGTASEKPGLAWALVALVALSALFTLAFGLARIFAPGEYRYLSLLTWPSSLVGVAERIVFLVFFVSLCGPARPWALIVSLAGGGIGVLRSLFFLAMPLIGSEFFISPAYPWVMAALGLVSVGTTLALVIGARASIAEGSGEAAGGVKPERPETAEAPASPGADFAIGSILLVVGIGVTVISYAAASGGGGGRYVVATGLIGVGLGRLIRGMIRLSKQ